MTEKRLTQAKVKELFNYDPLTGSLTWRVAPGFRVDLVGKEAGCLSRESGYRLVSVERVLCRVHRIIFLWMTGSIPPEVDHENHIRDDNRWENLVASTHAVNTRNMSLSSNNKSGYTGVHWAKRRKKWLASVRVNGKSIYIGIFKNKQDAIAARQAANKKYGFHENHGT